MNRVLNTMVEMNITDPAEVRRVAELIDEGASINRVQLQALELMEMNDQQLEIAIQQIIGGE